MADQKEKMQQLLLKLLEYEDQHGRGQYVEGPTIEELTKLNSGDINDAVEMLSQNGMLDVQHLMGTDPFEFGLVMLTARGRAAAKDLLNQIAAQKTAKAKNIISEFNKKNSKPQQATNPTLDLFPTGSPFGFTPDDWVQVRVDKDNIDRLIVVFGHQWKSPFFDTDKLRHNIGDMFAHAVNGLDPKKFRKVQLDFRPLQGGYGGHVFNKIARDIIGSDIAVFDASDANSNVMIEMGVALTWGIPTLPILDDKVGKIPSDISGLHWAKYKNSGAEWEETDHMKKLQAMVADAVAKKPAKRLYPG